ncbi:hypothetical protein [Chitinibacter sp. S2-10]|uniref:hypothetical protein n=1 Tax=Chitinibacter sp. S2-10 TaxID=3373597 RepID=UPI003977ACFF
MDNFDLENPYHTHRQPARKIPFLLIACCITSALLIYAYTNDHLPHYTMTIDGTTITMTRIDPKYLAEQAALEAEANRQIYRINGVEVSQEQYEQALDSQNTANTPAENEPQQIQYAEQARPKQQTSVDRSDYANGQPRKCIDGNGRAVYQTETCASKGFKTDKMLSSADVAVSDALTHRYKHEAQQQADSQPENVVSMGSQKVDRRAANCDHLEEQRESIRVAQRHNSNQSIRDAYASVSNEYHKCLSIKSSMSN